ncbi:MAG: hypothetical protein COX17_02095 [Deltaproteobacteria bacterium CG23_combo_of_CG06-09_8_20_14_all_60_8]|nr:MAG: hypothetical protein AUK28_09235 [Desulfobacterales bacterium CG2_30_60_27]PIP44308.1 MAG: hypothetical protein COX17_02095 [Deltaproteobacteria bacterium CG23_combo_of_CG06-09_8_20_14_all_60_8]
MGISCIIPTRDRRELVMAAIASVRAQDLAVEIVVVDDGSIDDTVARVRDCFPEVSLTRLGGEGPGAARNAGVAAATNDLLMFLDSDDLWLPGHARALQETMGRGFAVAYGVTRNRNAVHGGEFCLPGAGEAVEGDCFHALLRWCFLVPSALAMTRQAFVAAGGFGPGLLGEDWAFFLRLAARLPFGFAGSAPISERRLHRGSLCAMVDRRTILASVRRLGAASRADLAYGHLAVQRFEEMEQWVLRSEENWTTVQEWYTALRRDNMI